MSIKSRIATIVVAMALVVSVMCVGVFAAIKVTATGSGSVAFNNTDIYATITSQSFDPPKTETILTLDGGYELATADIIHGALTLTTEEQSFTVVIANTGTQALKITMAPAALSATGVLFGQSYVTTNGTSTDIEAAVDTTIAAGEVFTLTFTFQAEASTTNIAGDLSYSIVLDNVQPTEA